MKDKAIDTKLYYLIDKILKLKRVKMQESKSIDMKLKEIEAIKICDS